MLVRESVLHAIAVDGTYCPALRYRVARDLLDFGEAGRQLGVPVLRDLMGDEHSPSTIRIAVARVLGEQRPDLRATVQQFLRRLSSAVEPRARVEVNAAIGLFDTIEGVSGLNDIASAPTLDAGVRLRAAQAMAGLRHDYREAAAAVAREIAHDERVPRHIRRKAARDLARWSELCRAEARAILIELNE